VTRLVIDASALVELLLRTARGVSFGAAVRGRGLHVPAFCDVEVASALRRGLLAGALSISRAEQALDAYRDLPLARHGHLTLLPRIVAIRENFAAYDACYVALAERLEAAFLTADRGLARAVARHTSIPLAAH
jgi:predicted nucleic acid-binding protein